MSANLRRAAGRIQATVREPQPITAAVATVALAAFSRAPVGPLLPCSRLPVLPLITNFRFKTAATGLKSRTRFFIDLPQPCKQTPCPKGEEKET